MFLGQPCWQAVNKVEMRKHLLRLLWPLIYEPMLTLQLPLFLEIKSHFPCYLLKYDGLSLREKAVLWMCPDLFEISCLSICTETSRGEKSSFLPLKSSLLPKPVAGGGNTRTTSKGFLLSLSFLLCSLGYWILYNNSKGTCLKMNSIIRFFLSEVFSSLESVILQYSWIFLSLFLQPVKALWMVNLWPQMNLIRFKKKKRKEGKLWWSKKGWSGNNWKEMHMFGMKLWLLAKAFFVKCFRGRNKNKRLVFSRLGNHDDGSQEKFLRLNKESQGIQGQWRSMWRVTALIKRSDSVGCSEEVSYRAVKNCQTWSSSLNPWPEIGPWFSGPKAFYLGHSFSPAKHACYWNAKHSCPAVDVIAVWEMTPGKV